jgi:hypothetical protein
MLLISRAGLSPAAPAVRRSAIPVATQKAKFGLVAGILALAGSRRVFNGLQNCDIVRCNPGSSGEWRLRGKALHARSAVAYLKFSDLGDFVARNDAELRSVRGFHLLREQPTTVCRGEPASVIEFAQGIPFSVAPDAILHVEQVRTVKNGWAYVTTYIRPAESPERPEAEQWIHTFCRSAD